MRLIDADSFIEEARKRIDMQDLYLPVHIKEFVIDEMPTIDAAPSEKLKDFIQEIGAITYGKERFFYEDGVWYDRESCDYITTQTAIEACLKTVRELDDSVIDAVPVIRCKDCKHYYEKEWVVGGGSYTTCWYQTIANAQPNDFCSRAERKEE